MIERTQDPELLNRVMNHSDVRPWIVAGDGEIDIAPVLANPANVALVTEYGGFVLIQHEPGVYEVHSQFLKDGRGKHAVRAMREGFRYMFTQTDCLEVITKVANDNPASDGFAKLAGFRERFSRPKAWNGQDMSYRAVTIDDWVMRDTECPRAGESFHQQLEQAKANAGSELAVHDHDHAHDCYVGAAYLMFKAQPRKAVWFYNKWARFSGYATIELISDKPLVVDVRDAIIELGDDLNFLTVRTA